jgi:hypothetical protein
MDMACSSAIFEHEPRRLVLSRGVPSDEFIRMGCGIKWK